ncbi:hypothetical protein [Prosthecochloris sp. SCSIO W1103]|uniref:hypothetical protein n=1 Tax=Prosthecochloris sp. SCSIO W1103 TaxID=2992244 RepID=UPI00223D0CA5|nr:hypothetical protein [Prosthecochloris sp. SCSIO W1103]UZJ38778.1 hypothetical protein OO005_06150 [Prosthecochloris sp. SCSIO W1103]
MERAPGLLNIINYVPYYYFPHWDQTPDMLEKIETFLDKKDSDGGELPTLLRKLLIEQADDLKRILPILEKQQRK